MAIATALLALVFSGCKGGKPKPAAGLAAFTPSSANGGSGGERAVSSVEGPGGTTFHFEPLDGDDSPDRKGAEAYELSVEEKGDEVHLTIRANTSAQYDWKYVLGYVYYDAEAYNPVKYVPGDMFGEEDKAGEEFVTTAIFKVKGKAAFWHGLLNWDEKDAAHGGLVGTFVFNKEPWDPGRDASRAPDKGWPIELSDKVDDISAYKTGTPESRYIVWSEVNRGDGDISGEVTVADLTCLTAEWNRRSASPGIWNPRHLEVLDYWGNFHIYNDDIGVNWDNNGRTVGGYAIEGYSDPLQLNLLFSTHVYAPSFNVRSQLRSLPCGPENGIANWFHSLTGQLGYKYTHLQLYNRLDIWVRVRPFDQSLPPQWGIWSDLHHVKLADNQAPDVRLNSSCTTLKVPYAVDFDASMSVDPDGHIAEYRWDLDGNGTFEYSSGISPSARVTYVTPGDYIVSVRAIDNYGLHSDASVDIIAKSFLNEAGFEERYARYQAVLDDQGRTYYRFFVPVLFRDTSLPLANVNGVRLCFTQGGQYVDWNRFDAKVCDNIHNPWLDGAVSGVLNIPAQNRVLFYPFSFLLPAPTKVEFAINYGFAGTAAPVESSGLACIFRFYTTANPGVSRIRLEFMSDNVYRTYYTDFENNASLLCEYSDYPELPIGFSEIICDPTHIFNN